MDGGVFDVFRRPVAVRYIVKAVILLHDILGSAAVHVKEAHSHGGKLGAGDGALPLIGAVPVSHGNAVAGKVLHIARVPAAGGNVAELHLVPVGDALIQLVRQQTGEDGRGLAPAHILLRPKGAVRVAYDVGSVVLGFRDSGNGQFAVLIGFAGFPLPKVALDDNGHALLRPALVVGHGDGNAVVLVHILTVRENNRNIAALADGHTCILNGASGFVVHHGDGQRPAVAVLILPAHGGIAVRIGVAGGAGDSELPGLVSPALTIIVVLVGHGDKHSLDGALVLHKLHLDRGLVCIVQQAGTRQTDGQGMILTQRDRCVGNRILGVRVSDRHQIAAHNSLALAVRGGLIIDFLDVPGFQRFAADGTLLMPAALAVRGGFLVHDPVAGLVACRLGVIALVGIAATGTGEGGIAHFRAGRFGHNGFIVMPQSVLNDRATASAELGGGASGRFAGGMASGLVALQPRRAAADAGVFGHALAGAGGSGDLLALIPAMT